MSISVRSKTLVYRRECHLPPRYTRATNPEVSRKVHFACRSWMLFSRNSGFLHNLRTERLGISEIILAEAFYSTLCQITAIHRAIDLYCLWSLYQYGILCLKTNKIWLLPKISIPLLFKSNSQIAWC